MIAAYVAQAQAGICRDNTLGIIRPNLGRDDSGPRRTAQMVIHGNARKTPRVAWSFLAEIRPYGENW